MEESKLKKMWFVIWRGIFESEIWTQEPWRFKVWIYMIGKANHKEQLKKKLKRGELYISNIKDFCKEVSWKNGFISKRPTNESMKQFWRWLRKEGMITTRKTTRGTIITIKNYEKYQNKHQKKTLEKSVSSLQINADTTLSPNADTTNQVQNGGWQTPMQTPASPHDRQQLKQYNNITSSNKETKSLIYFYKQSILEEYSISLEVNYPSCIKRLQSLLNRKNDKWEIAELKEALRFYIHSEKAKKFGYGLTTALSVDSLNKYKSQKQKSSDLYVK